MVKKKWLLVTLIVVVVILVVLGIGIGTVLSIHNSTYDCSYVYVPTDDLLNELAKKHTYYDATTKTVEIELNQDMINSLIKDNFESFGIALPDKFSIKELLFNTKDQRLYINGKYGSINLPISFKINVNITADGIELSASDLNLSNKKAPSIVANQVPLDSFTYSVKYEDFDLPRIFELKDVYFGSGILKVYVQLLPDKIKEMAMDYRNDLLAEINKFKSEQSELIDRFLTRLLDSTKLLSDAKVEEFVDFVLNSEELVNSAIYFALAEDLGKYSEQFTIVQNAIADWVAPLGTIQVSDSIEETVESILYNQELKEFVEWFMPAEELDEYIVVVEEYYGMYEEYYGMYEDLLGTIDELESAFASISFGEFDDIESAVATLQDQIFRNTKLMNILSQFIPTDAFTEISDMIDEYVAMYYEYMDMLDDMQNSIAEAAAGIDFSSVTEVLDEYVAFTDEYFAQVDELKQIAIDVVEQIDVKLIQDLVHFLEFGSTLGQEFIATIHPDNYALFREYVDYGEDIKLATIDVLKEVDFSSVSEGIDANVAVVKDFIDFADEVVTMLENKEIEGAIDVLMNADFTDMLQFEEVIIEIPDLEEYGWEIEL
jgi:hypothetical protein